MFYERFISLCEYHAKTPKEVLRELGFKKNINYKLHKWETGARPHSSTVHKIAEYFNVLPSYFYVCKYSTNVVGNQIRLHRELCNITQTELARRVDMTQNGISLIENGNVELSLKTTIKIADILGCTVDDLTQKSYSGSKTVRETQIIRLYSSLDDEGKSKVEKYLTSLIKAQHKKEE